MPLYKLVAEEKVQSTYLIEADSAEEAREQYETDPAGEGSQEEVWVKEVEVVEVKEA